MNPVLKYRGGKSREIPQFSRYIPKQYGRYLEPFLGGGALYFYLEPEHAVLNDINPRLMNFYRDLRDRYPQMRLQLEELQTLYEKNQAEYRRLKEQHPEAHVPNANEELYYRMRELYNHPDGTYLESVLYYFINKTAYSGMIRYNRNGEYNVPFGRYQHLNTGIVTAQHSSLLQNAQLLCGDYSAVFERAQPDDFMFLDPPYDCVFNDYGNQQLENGFDETQQRRLAADFKNLRCRALMVIGGTSLTRELYQGYIAGEYGKTYAVNIRNRFRHESTHLILCNY